MSIVQGQTAEIDAAFARNDYANAKQLAMAALAQTPNDSELLVRAASASHKVRDWHATAAFAGRLLDREHLSPAELVRAVELGCIAAYMLGGTPAVHTLYRPSRRFVRQIVAEQPDQSWFVQAALRASVLAGDHDVAFDFFLRLFGARWGNLSMAAARTCTLQAWCDTHGTPITVLEPARFVSSAEMPDASGTWSYVTQTARYAVIPRAEILLGWDFVITPTGEVISDSGYSSIDVSYGWFSNHVIEGTGLVVHLWSAVVQDIDVDVLVLAGPAHFHIGHWIVDFMPQPRALDLASDRKVVVPATAPKKVFELLQLFGIGEDRILRCDMAKRYRFRSALVVQHGKSSQPSPDSVRFIARSLNKPVAPGTRGRRLFLDRDSPTRRIANREDFDQAIAALGFETVSLAKMSIAEQRDALGAADIVLGAHGSEMLACFFMHPGAHLIEMSYGLLGLLWENAATSDYLGVRHHLLLCRAAEHIGVTIQRKDSDFHVATAALRDLVSTLSAG